VILTSGYKSPQGGRRAATISPTPAASDVLRIGRPRAPRALLSRARASRIEGGHRPPPGHEGVREPERGCTRHSARARRGRQEHLVLHARLRKREREHVRGQLDQAPPRHFPTPALMGGSSSDLSVKDGEQGWSYRRCRRSLLLTSVAGALLLVLAIQPVHG
jgi:hypothetical protein